MGCDIKIETIQKPVLTTNRLKVGDYFLCGTNSKRLCLKIQSNDGTPRFVYLDDGSVSYSVMTDVVKVFPHIKVEVSL